MIRLTKATPNKTEDTVVFQKYVQATYEIAGMLTWVMNVLLGENKANECRSEDGKKSMSMQAS